MKNFLKYSTMAAAVIALAMSAKAVETIAISDAGGGGTIFTVDTTQILPGEIVLTTADNEWNIVVATGLSEPPAPGSPASSPIMDLNIQATYNGPGAGGGVGSPLIISFANDTFGPTSGTFLGTLTGHGFQGNVQPIGWTIYWGPGSDLPTPGVIIPGGASSVSGTFPISSLPVSMVSPFVSLGNPYTLGETVVLTATTAGTGYSFDASITTVPDGGMTLVFLGSALAGLALLKRKLA